MRKKTKKRPREEVIAEYNRYIPVIAEKAAHWEADDAGLVTIFIENTGAMNRIMQKIAKKPRVSQVHLDEKGSFIWQRCDGETDVEAIAQAFKKRFGKKAEPLYERLLKFFEIVESYEFMRFLKPADGGRP